MITIDSVKKAKKNLRIVLKNIERTVIDCIESGNYTVVLSQDHVYSDVEPEHEALLFIKELVSTKFEINIVRKHPDRQ